MKAFLLTFLIPYSIALRCFQCSDLNANQAKDCPSSSKEISQWSNLPGHYSENNDKKGLACVLGVDSSKNVYFQAKLDENQCKSSGYQTTIKIKINQKSNTESEVLCCTKDGCNWNYTTTQNNLSFDEILASNNATGSVTLAAGTDWVPVVLVIIIIIIILICICCFFLLGKKKKNKENRRPEVPKHNLRPVGNDRDIPVTPVRNISQVAVEALDTPTRNKYQKKDQERYSAIDRKIYKRNQEPYPLRPMSDRYHLNTGTTTSSGYSSSTASAYSGADPVTVYGRDRIGKISKTVFDTEDYHQANQNITPEELRMPRKGQDWNHIWKSATADPKSRDQNSHANNAFRFNSP